MVIKISFWTFEKRKLCSTIVEKTFGLVSVVLYKGDYIMESLINCDYLDEASIKK